MTDREKVQFIIDRLGFMGATHTLRVTKERVFRLLAGEPFTINVRRYANNTIKNIQIIEKGDSGKEIIHYLYDLKRRRPNVY